MLKLCSIKGILCWVNQGFFDGIHSRNVAYTISLTQRTLPWMDLGSFIGKKTLFDPNVLLEYFVEHNLVKPGMTSQIIPKYFVSKKLKNISTMLLMVRYRFHSLPVTKICTFISLFPHVQRLVHRDDCLDRTLYPLLIKKHWLWTRKCFVCKMYTAR